MATKKKIAKKTTLKHDPKEEFVVTSMTRAHIADDLNSAIDQEKIDDPKFSFPKFTENDRRLTKKFCQDYADTIYDARNQDSDSEEADAVVAYEKVRELAGISND